MPLITLSEKDRKLYLRMLRRLRKSEKKNELMERIKMEDNLEVSTEDCIILEEAFVLSRDELHPKDPNRYDIERILGIIRKKRRSVNGYRKRSGYDEYRAFREICPQCKGIGRVGYFSCPLCKGSGRKPPPSKSRAINGAYICVEENVIEG